MLFWLPDLKADADIAAILKVFRVHRSTLSRVMATHFSTTMYTSDRLLNVVASLEAYAKARQVGGKLQVKLQWCVNSIGIPPRDFFKRSDVLVKRLNSARQEVAHHYKGVDDHSLDQYFLSRVGYAVFVMCLLAEAGVAKKVLRKVATNREVRFNLAQWERGLPEKYRSAT